MAANSKVVVTTFSLTFGGTAYDARSIAGGVIETADPADVTVGKDGEQRFAAAAVTEDGPITATMPVAPALNSTGALKLVKKQREAGGDEASDDVTIGKCIVTSVTPAEITSDGDRVQWFDVTFTPDGTRS